MQRTDLAGRPPMFDTAESVEEAFYDAMRRGDLVGMMSLWSTDDDIACLHPGGSRLLGFDAIRASWEAIFAGGSVAIQTTGLIAHTGAMLAMHNLSEQIIVPARPASQLVVCAVTNVYLKSNLGWRIVLHHASQAGAVEPMVPVGAILH